MRCADPVLVYNQAKGGRLFRHFSLASDNFKKIHHLVFDCGKCIVCRKKRAYELACRCVLHASLYKENCFVTLTYDEKLPKYHNNFEYSDIQKFKKRLRQDLWRKHTKRIEIFNVHEYGKKGKKHWHLIIFNHAFPDRIKNPGSKYYNSEELKKFWPYGHHSIGDVTEASAMYQASYMEKDFKHRYVTSKKKSHSKHAGIAKNYFLKHYRQILQLGYVPINGTKMPIPRYFIRLGEKLAMQGHQEMYQLLADYGLQKDQRISDLEKEWSVFMQSHLTTKLDPDFIMSASNQLYDLRNELNPEEF